MLELAKAMVFELYQEKGLEVEMVQVMVRGKVMATDLVQVTGLVEVMVRVKVTEMVMDLVQEMELVRGMAQVKVMDLVGVTVRVLEEVME